MVKDKNKRDIMARKKVVYTFDYDSKFLNEHNVKKLAKDVTRDADTSEKILDCLFTAEVTDEQIAEATGIKLNFVRKILYKLYDVGMANYTRKKDPETQWFTYYWRFDSRKAAQIIEEQYNRHNKEIKESLEFEENNKISLGIKSKDTKTCCSNRCNIFYGSTSLCITAHISTKLDGIVL